MFNGTALPLTVGVMLYAVAALVLMRVMRRAEIAMESE